MDALQIGDRVIVASRESTDYLFDGPTQWIPFDLILTVTGINEEWVKTFYCTLHRNDVIRIPKIKEN